MRKFCFIMLGLVLTFFISCSNPVSEEENSFVVSFNAGVLKNVIDTNEWFSDCTDVSFRIELWVYDYDNMKNTTTTYDDYTVNENYNYNSYNSDYSYNRKNSNSYSDDEYNVKIYSDSDDFYEDHYDDFDGFEDADDYYEDHID